MSSEHGGPTRRNLLLGGAGLALVASACSTPTTRSGAVPKARPDPPETTVEALFSRTPFYIAHRGSGDNWPEHTDLAYTRSLAAGAGAIEVSVNATKDGVLICHHDRTTLRMTGRDHAIADTYFATLKDLQVDARQWLGPGSELQPIARAVDVLDEHAKSHVIFIDDKQGSNTQALLELMDTYPDSRKHMVWKQSAAGKQVKEVRERGYKAWGYFGLESLSRIDELAPNFDFLGITHLAPDDVIREMVSTGKPVICWEVHRRHMRDRLVRLGVQGIMCSNISYVMSGSHPAQNDAFDTGFRAAGDLPWTTDRGWGVQPDIHVEEGSIVLADGNRPSYLMGSMAVDDRSNYEVQIDLRWPEGLPAPTQHAGLCFGQLSDNSYRVGMPSEVAGYHLILRQNGSLELLHRDAKTASGDLLGGIETEPMQPGQWATLWVSVTETGVGFARIDSSGWRKFVRTDSLLGGYFSLSKNYAGGPPVEFRNITVS